jgi:signal transduction histidine kinase
MSHEIRTPLNSVIGFSDLLVKNSLNDTQQQYVQAIHRSANSLMDLINDILDFSKIEAGKLELSVEKTDLWELSAHVAEITKYKANEKGLELLLHTSPEMPRFAQLDPVRIRQVLVNLMGNAIKFTEEGEVELSIVLVSVDEKSQEACLEFSVRDTGIGISPDKQEKIFEAFSQEDSSTTRKYGGTGLGLTISNKLLSLMGSRLELESKPGKGTRFFFRLDLPVSNSAQNEWEGLSDFRKVLVVDDNEQNCQILKDMLSLADIESDVAYNGLEALSKLGSSQQYDLMIIDYHMPYLDGLEVIRKTREELRLNAEEIPIVLLHSSYDDAHIRQVCKQLDVHVQIFKPITSQKLYTTLYRFKKSLVDQPELVEEVKVLNTENRSVLIVDDVPFNVQLAGSMVQTLLPQMQILEAKNGREALKIFTEHQPDLVLLDIQMPEMSGYEVSKEIRKLEKDSRVPIIAVTASTVKGEFERCLDAGMDDYLSKPILLDSLGKKLNKWLNLDEAQQPEANLVGDSIQQEDGLADHFDYEGFRQVLNVPESVIRSLISELLDQVRTSVAELQSAFEEQDFERMRKIGHRLKGSTSMGKMSRLSRLAEQLEKNKDMEQDDICQLLIKIEQEASHVLTIIDSVLQQMQPS